jgi:hypothetical protein
MACEAQEGLFFETVTLALPGDVVSWSEYPDWCSLNSASSVQVPKRRNL